MKRFSLVFLLITLGMSELTYEKYTWIGEIADWGGYLMYLGWADRLDWEIVSSPPLVLMPFLSEHPHATLEYDKLVAESMSKNKSLDWALDSLRSELDSLLELSNPLRKKTIFYLYVDRLESLEKPLKIDQHTGRYLAIDDGTGTSEKGFIRMACLTGVDGGFEYGGPLLVSWAATGDTVMDSVRALEAFNLAAEEGMLVTLADDPKWGKPSSLVHCAAPFYGRPAYRIRARVTYDYKFEPERQMRVSDSYYVFVLVKGGYEYLVAFLADGGCFDPSNVADFLTLTP
jgi:hypothetical protein